MKYRWVVIVAAVCSTAQMPPVSDQARAALDGALGAKGVYVSEESAYRFLFPRADVSVRIGAQRLSPEQAPASWATFAPSKRREAMVSAELVVLDDEVNPTISVALKSGLEVTGLGPVLLSSQPTLLALNVSAEGSYSSLGAAVRKVLDEVRRIRADKRGASETPKPGTTPTKNAIDAAPLNAILSMRGAAPDGIYRASIGRIGLLNGTPVGREMGMSTRLTISGTSQQALLDADLIATDDELQRVLSAITTRNLNISAIRNHFVGDHPQAFFVRFWGQGTASDLARALRYVLDVQTGAARSGK